MYKHFKNGFLKKKRSKFGQSFATKPSINRNYVQGPTIFF